MAALGGDPAAADSVPTAAAILLVAYPLIDVLASAVEARENSASAQSYRSSTGSSASPRPSRSRWRRQRRRGTTLAVFGVWAFVSGALQLGTAAMRRRAGSHELTMIVSGAISAVAGLSFVAGSSQDVAHLTNLAGYAGLGAVLYLVWARAPAADPRA